MSLGSMPLYEYQCRSCGHRFEGLVRGSDVPSCPACQGRDLERLLSAFAMSSEERTREIVKATRKKLAPIRQNEQREEFQRTLREHLHDD
jgi:putative FmdB family regulatory protein